MLSLLLHPVWQLLLALSFSIFPIWCLANRLPVDSLTKLLLSVVGNFLLIYLLELIAYFLRLPQWVPFVIVTLCVICSVVDVYRNRRGFAWDGVLAWTGLAIWILGLQSLIVCYGAASWYGDWFEHYERSIWFYAQQSPDHRFLFNMWSLAARGPLFNSICGLLFCFGNDFGSYQVYATVLNSLPVLPLALLIRDISGFQRSPALIWSMLICGIAPFAVQQETYPWTKFFTAGLLLSGIYLYRFGMTEKKKWFVAFSFVAFSAAILAHYLSVLFVIFFAVHFLYSVFKKKWEPRFVATVLILCFLLLSTWFGFIFARFGFRGTLEATSTFGSYGKRQGSPPWSLVFAGNMVTTTIPYSWRLGWKDTWHGIGQAKRLVQRESGITPPRFTPTDSELDIRSEWLAELATNPNSLLGCLGFAGMIGLVLSFIPKFGKHSKSSKMPGTVFWLLFFLLGIPLNILASRDYSAIGLAHLNLQPFILLIAVFLLRRLRVYRKILTAILALFLVESVLITGGWISIQHRKLPISIQNDGRPVISGKLAADGKYIRNYIYKMAVDAVYLSDHLGSLTIPFWFLTTTLGVASGVVIHRNRVKFSVDR